MINLDCYLAAALVCNAPRRYWNSAGTDQIDAVVLAGRARHPILFGEAKWARSVDARRLAPRLTDKARDLLVATVGATEAEMADTPLRLSYCAREQVRNAPLDTLVVTAADIFPG
ncbi:hypothetical protein [Pseudofrankia sp. DC12]|uniref:hypothetical protein n=1 Tax=Pseudofrankia sp. DC12 TaxID=683315 RepID=UPI0005F83E82|nr:hypothetical protein [Pseudofrankia sp. DC12]